MRWISKSLVVKASTVFRVFTVEYLLYAMIAPMCIVWRSVRNEPFFFKLMAAMLENDSETTIVSGCSKRPFSKAAARSATRRIMSVTSADGRESVSAQCLGRGVFFFTHPAPSCSGSSCPVVR